MPPAARVTDMHVCPMVTGLVPHVGGPILPPGAPTVLIDFLPAATVTTMATCVGPPDVIVKGSAGVFINFLPAARLGDQTAHGGVIVMGSPTCMIGEIGSPSPGSAGLGGIVAGLVASGIHTPSNEEASSYGEGATRQAKEKIIKDACAAHGITDPVKQESHVDGVDLGKPVTVEKLHAGDMFDMWVRDGGQPGIYAAPAGANPKELGIITANRHLERFQVQSDMQMVKSTAKDFEVGRVAEVGGKGGGTQYMLPPTWKGSVKRI